MMKKLIIFVALAVCLCMVATPVAASVPMYESKYVAVNPANAAAPSTAGGWVVFNIRAGGSAQDLNIYVINDNQKNVTFDASFNPDKSDIIGQNKDFLLVKILPDGLSIQEQLATGSYTAYLRNGNGGQMEVQHFKIGGGAIETVTFLGHAVETLRYIEPLTASAQIDYKDVCINGLKIVRDEWVPAREEQKWVHGKWVGYGRSRHYVEGHYETITIPGYWTYKLEGRVTVKSINTEIGNVNDLSLKGVVSVTVRYAVDTNFNHAFNPTQALAYKERKFYGTFTANPKGTTYYDAPITFSCRINDATIDDNNFPEVTQVGIDTIVPAGYHLRT
jgi:hypothetical protein